MAITLNTIIGNPLCAENCTGQIFASATGGVEPYTYRIRPGGENLTGVFSGLCPGSYIITVVDYLGEMASTKAVLYEATPIDFGVATLGSNASASGVTGGNAPYEYSLDNGTFQSDPNFTSVAYGTHTMTVRDDNGCVSTKEFSSTPIATYGYTDSDVYIYDASAEVFEKACLGALSPGMRVKVCFDMSAGSYNNNLVTNGAGGSFARNIVGIGTILSDDLPNDLEDYVLSEETPLVLNGTSTGGCAEFRIPEDWTGMNYFIAVYVFKITLPNKYTYTDRIYYKVPLNVVAIDDGSAFTPVLQDTTGVALTSICDNPTAPIFKVKWTKNIAEDFDIHYLIFKNGEFLGEYDPYNNVVLGQLSTPFLDTGGSNTSLGPFSVNVNSNFLDNGEYCVRAIMIEDTGSSEVTCDCVQIDITRTIGTFNASGVASATIEYDLPGLTDLGVDNVVLILNPSPGDVIGTSGDANDTFSYNAEQSTTPDTITGRIVLTDGCVYEINPPINLGVPTEGVTTGFEIYGPCCGAWEIQAEDNGDGTSNLTAVRLYGACDVSLIYWHGAGDNNANPITVPNGATYDLTVTCGDSCLYTDSITI